MTEKEQELTRLVETLTTKRDGLQNKLRNANDEFDYFRNEVIQALESSIPVKYNSLVHYIEGGGLK